MPKKKSKSWLESAGSWVAKKLKSSKSKGKVAAGKMKTINPIKGAGKRKAPTKADDMARASAFPKAGKKLKDASPAEIKKMQKAFGYTKLAQPKNIAKDAKKLVHGQKKNGKFWNSKTGKWVKTLAAVGTAVGGGYAINKLMSGDKKKIDPYEIKPAKPKIGNPGEGNEITKGQIKKAKPKTSVKPKAPVKKKSRSNISNSSSYDAKFTADKLRKQGKGESFVKSRMGKGNYKKATTLFKGGKASNYYSGGGTVFTGR